MTYDLTALVGALARVPLLAGARCRGRADLFDGSDGPEGERTRLAAALCNACPALAACSDWADSQPDNKLDGVIAGRLFAYAPHAARRPHPNGIVVPLPHTGRGTA
jgi:hypothetical protein